MNNRAARLDRARKVFAMQARMHEIELSRLRRQVEEIAITLAELDGAMASPLVSMLPVHAITARKYAVWQRQLVDSGGAASMELKKLAEVKVRERLSGSLSKALINEQVRIEAENDVFELISLRVSASLPQGETD